VLLVSEHFCCWSERGRSDEKRAEEEVWARWEGRVTVLLLGPGNPARIWSKRRGCPGCCSRGLERRGDEYLSLVSLAGGSGLLVVVVGEEGNVG
jgi:hypothetical protein